MKKGITSVLLFLSLAGMAQSFQRVSIPGTEVRKLISAEVQGQEYEIQVHLPGGYANSDAKYPVVYLMDAQWDFPLVHSIYGEQYYDGFIPALIIVGVTWGGVNPNPDSLRVRDYTPTKVLQQPQSGGADRFLSFMKKELFPFIETNYRADPAKRVLMGCSLGGLFTLYSLFTQPELFNGYAAASPAIGWDRGIVNKYEKEFSSKKINRPVRVYITEGDVERGRPFFERFISMMNERQYPDVQIQSKILENTGHSGTKNETYSRGLQYIFERPRLQLSRDILDGYTGRYQPGNALPVEIKLQENQLVLYLSPGNAYPLQAGGDGFFYSLSEFLTIRFNDKNAPEKGFQLDTYGNSRYFRKINQ